jgi:hypothetical protein
MESTMPKPDWNDPWVLERSRALHAELDAAPTDKVTQDDIIGRHTRAAKEERPDLVVGEPWEDPLSMALLFAALPPMSAEEFRAALVLRITPEPTPRAPKRSGGHAP